MRCTSRPASPSPPARPRASTARYPQAGLASLELVGKVLTSSGKDYLLAKGAVGGGYMLEGKAVVQTKLYYR